MRTWRAQVGRVQSYAIYDRHGRNRHPSMRMRRRGIGIDRRLDFEPSSNLMATPCVTPSNAAHVFVSRLRMVCGREHPGKPSLALSPS